MTTKHRFMLAAVAVLALPAFAPLMLSAQAPPAGATFKCKDGTYSTAATARGACSRHGGVDQALAAPAAAAAPARAPAAAPRTAAAPAGATFRCNDGTFSTAAAARGACSRHGGVAAALGGAAAAAPVAASAPAAAAPPARPSAAAAAPAGAPANATALCKDGTYSTSQHRSGTCSRHGGVQTWINQPAN